MFFGDGVFEFDDVLGAEIRVRESGKFEQSGNVRLIFGADFAHAITRGKIIFAVGHIQAALQQVGGIVFGVVKAGCDPESEKICGMKVGVIQGIDVRAEAFTQSSGQFMFVADRGDRVELRAERSEAFGFDGGLVHVGVVQVSNFACVGAGRSIGLGGLFDQAGGMLAAQVFQSVPAAYVTAVGGNFGVLDPVAVCVVEEIITGLDGAVHLGDDYAVSLRRGRTLRIGGK